MALRDEVESKLVDFLRLNGKGNMTGANLIMMDVIRLLTESIEAKSGAVVGNTGALDVSPALVPDHSMTDTIHDMMVYNRRNGDPGYSPSADVVTEDYVFETDRRKGSHVETLPDASTVLAENSDLEYFKNKVEKSVMLPEEYLSDVTNIDATHGVFEGGDDVRNIEDFVVVCDEAEVEPERRVFEIDVGDMPADKVEELLEQVKTDIMSRDLDEDAVEDVSSVDNVFVEASDSEDEVQDEDDEDATDEDDAADEEQVSEKPVKRVAKVKATAPAKKGKKPSK